MIEIIMNDGFKDLPFSKFFVEIKKNLFFDWVANHGHKDILVNFFLNFMLKSK